MFLQTISLLTMALISCTFAQITTAPFCPIQADPWHSQAALRVQKRQVTTYCDSNSKFYCFAPAACVSGHDGYMGCCLAASGTTCSPRSTCIDYTTNAAVSCNYITGGCVYCSDPSLPFCTTQFEDGKYVLGCNTRPFTTTWSGSDAQTAVIGVVSSALPLSSSAVVPLVTSTTVIQLINSASRTSALVPSLNQSPTSSSALSSPSEPSTLPKKDSISTSRGLIVGVVIGAAAGSIVLLILLFVLYKWWKQRKATFTTNTTQDANDKPHQGNNYSLGPANNEYIEHNNNRNNSHNPSELDEQSHGSTLIGRQQNTLAANGFPPYQPYANTHPYSPQDIQGVAEAPANVPPHAWSSPAISHMTSPTPSNSSLWMVRTPRMAPTGGYVAFTPSSNYSAAGGQPPSSLPQTRFEGRGVGRASELAELEAKEVGSA